MSVTFYDGPSGRLFMTGPAGGGNSTFNGPATDRDVMLNPDAYTAYLAAKANAERVEEPIEPAPAPETIVKHDEPAPLQHEAPKA